MAREPPASAVAEKEHWRPFLGCAGQAAVASLNAALLLLLLSRGHEPAAAWPPAPAPAAVEATAGTRLLGAAGGPGWSSAPVPTRRRATQANQLEGSPEQLCSRIWDEAVVREQQEPRYLEFNAALLALPRQCPNLVVHVGKTAGASLHQALEGRGLLRNFDWLHVHPASEAHLQSTRLVVVPLRDPVDRAVSSFRWLATVAKKERRKAHLTGLRGMQRGFFRCFPTVEAFAMSVDEDTLCGQRARAALVDPEMYRGHLNKGLCFYLGGLLEELKRVPVLVVRSSHFEADAGRLLRRLGQAPLRPSEVRDAHNNSRAAMSAKLSAAGRAKLEHFLRHEYFAYRQLLSLDPAIQDGP